VSFSVSLSKFFPSVSVSVSCSVSLPLFCSISVFWLCLSPKPIRPLSICSVSCCLYSSRSFFSFFTLPSDFYSPLTSFSPLSLSICFSPSVTSLLSLPLSPPLHSLIIINSLFLDLCSTFDSAAFRCLIPSVSLPFYLFSICLF
jgi:hypothetical protein